jgi:hypothetical protein
MNLDLLHIILVLSCVILMGTSTILFLYIRKAILPVIIASEESSELFTRLQTYASHIKSVYELPTFYGDDTLKSLLDHSQDLFTFLGRYENIYSFTQPDLLETLEKIDDEYNQEETQEKEK